MAIESTSPKKLNQPKQPLEKIKAQETRMVAAPKDYFLGPVFAAAKQTGPRKVTVRVKVGNEIVERCYQIGGFHPMRRNLCPPALDVRHARAIFSLLSFRDPYDDSGSRLIKFSFNEFCQRYARSNGGRYARAIALILGDLMDSYIRITDLKDPRQATHEYRLIERIDIENRPPRRRDSRLATSGQTEMWFNGCTLSPEFSGLLNRIAELQHLNLDVFTSIRSPLAQAIYLYIPSRAHHHAESNPFEISLTKLLEQVSFNLPPQKQRRRQIFTQHEKEGRSVLQQLNGLETLKGRFYVRLAETTDGMDWKLQAWVERNREAPKFGAGSKLIEAYLHTGRAREFLDQALSNIQPLSDYEQELLEKANVKLEGNTRFFELAKAILKEARFATLLAEAKGDALEGRRAIKNETARLIHRIKEAVGAPLPAAKRCGKS